MSIHETIFGLTTEEYLTIKAKSIMRGMVSGTMSFADCERQITESLKLSYCDGFDDGKAAKEEQLLPLVCEAVR